ncbi:ecdysteroid-regulated 16 kDa protein-like [Leptidea sinapis]|uniref:ecdysteroid-regulated 16 kDa protein-like n=1 Tax=Leptidea sinapis TaxID=189913 RepID=UPI0021C33B42|nr:ecdysteroid-regulated 16 kDa protein-like [Leptidea sinapis]
MFSQCLVVCCLLGIAVASNLISQCPGQSIPNLSENVQLQQCKKSPCKLRKGSTQNIVISFIPEKDVDSVTNHVVANLLGIDLPFIGVDGQDVCDKITTTDGQKASCPLKAGTTYTYRDSFPIYQVYPSIEAKVHWSLIHNKKDIVCFEVPIKIV